MGTQKICLPALALITALMSGLVAAESVAIAYSRSDGNMWGWARKPSQSEANKIALELCNRSAQNRDCALSTIKALVRAEGPGRIGYGWSDKSLSDAKRDARANCKHSDCKVVDVISKPGFITLSRSEYDAEGSAIFHVAYAFDNSDEADKKALAQCTERSGRNCKIILSTSIAGTLGKESSASPRPAPPAISSQNCRPNTPTVRCQSQCVNGDCVISYENGCKMHVRVSPRYDSFQNTWTYPSPSC